MAYSYGPYSYGRMLAALATGSTINGAAGRNQWSCQAQRMGLPGSTSDWRCVVCEQIRKQLLAGAAVTGILVMAY